MNAPSWPATSLWSRRQAVVAAVVLAAGVALAVTGWFSLTGRPAVRDQVGPLAVAVTGAMTALLAELSWILAGRSAVATRRRLLIGTSAAAPGTSGGRRPSSPVLVAGEGLRLYHRADCPLAPPDARAFGPELVAGQAAGRLPCGVCRP